MDNKREFVVDIIIVTPSNITQDKLLDELITFVTSKGYTMGGMVEEYIDGSNSDINSAHSYTEGSDL